MLIFKGFSGDCWIGGTFLTEKGGWGMLARKYKKFVTNRHKETCQRENKARIKDRRRKFSLRK